MVKTGFLVCVLLLALFIVIGCEQTPPAPPEPGEWTSATEFGELRFTVNSDSTGITEIVFEFDEFECSGMTWVSGGVTYQQSPNPWPITDNMFTVDVFLNPWEFVIEGEFDSTGTQASGTWEIEDSNCSGTWESTPAH